MGNALCGHVKHATQKVNAYVASGDFTDAPEGIVCVLICAMDYKLMANSLSCTYDGRNMQELCSACGVENVTYMNDEQMPLTKEAVCEQIESLMSQLTDGDTFIFYYSGHGTNINDQEGGEDEDEDEAYCFQDEDGQVNFQSCLSDDAFAEVMTSNTPEGVKVIVLSDCCHSDTICDFSKPSWGGIQAASISGCQDSQTSGDVGTGGIFTHSMLCAIEKIATAQNTGQLDSGAYSVGKLYNATLASKKKRFASAEQIISIENTLDTTTDGLIWPLVPVCQYQAPLNQASRGVGGPSKVPSAIAAMAEDDDDDDGAQLAAALKKRK